MLIDEMRFCSVRLFLLLYQIKQRIYSKTCLSKIFTLGCVSRIQIDSSQCLDVMCKENLYYHIRILILDDDDDDNHLIYHKVSDICRSRKFFDKLRFTLDVFFFFCVCVRVNVNPSFSSISSSSSSVFFFVPYALHILTFIAENFSKC